MILLRAFCISLQDKLHQKGPKIELSYFSSNFEAFFVCKIHIYRSLSLRQYRKRANIYFFIGKRLFSLNWLIIFNYIPCSIHCLCFSIRNDQFWLPCIKVLKELKRTNCLKQKNEANAQNTVGSANDCLQFITVSNKWLCPVKYCVHTCF